jgi:hypothetical protein
LGNLYSLYGRGLSLNMTQNQNIDYDNSLVGIEVKYNLNNLNIFTLLGNSKFEYRSNAANLENDLQLDNEVFFIGSELYTDNLGIIMFSFLNQSSLINKDVIHEYWYHKLFDAGIELSERFSSTLPALDDRLKTMDYNLSWNYQFFGADFYIDKVWNTYTKILGDTELGSKLYLSFYFDISGTGITYEYKNYDQKYHIPTLSGAPIGFREGNSTLASRNNHAMNWGDEVGHQIELNRSIGDFQWMGNLSFSYKHAIDRYEPVNFSQVLKMDNESDIFHQYPFRQLYSEISGYTLNDKLYIKLGIDQFDEFKGYDNPEHLSAITYPAMFTFDLSGGNSITSYLERQNRNELKYNSDLFILEDWNFINNYFSFTLNHFRGISLSFFYEDETSDKITYETYNYEPTLDIAEICINQSQGDGYLWNGNDCVQENFDLYNNWIGYDLSYKINSTSQFSFFYGSQKGGLVCANGVCAEQPGFDDGIKVTLRTIF